MATCNLKIDLDEPKQIRLGGETITGTVIVDCQQDTNCKGLEISTAWSTHGRGNLDHGLGELVVAYQGAWHAGQEYRYPFKLKVAPWPPTYYGTYINVSHCVVARAKLAWKTDPRVEKEFPVMATTTPDDLQPVRQPKAGGAKVIIYVLLAIFGLAFGLAFIWLIPFLLIIAGLVWFFKFFLPKQLTGSVKCDVEPKRLQAGEKLKAHLSFTPKRSVKVNGVSYTVSCVEKCVSGSGSNRTTHTHELLKQTEALIGEGLLPAGQLQSFDVAFQIPRHAAPSMKLSDNEITWSVVFRIDIPRWPDWTETITLVVTPTADRHGVERHGADRHGAAIGGKVAPDNSMETVSSDLQTRSDEDEWFDQVLKQLEDSRDRERLQLVLGAIREHEFTLSLSIGEEMDREEFGESTYRPDVHGRWLSAYDERRDLDVALFVPDALELPQPESVWRGRIGIVDYSEDELTLFAKMLG